jgi:hypothetical protein
LANPIRLDPISRIEVRFLFNPIEHQPLGSGFHFCPKLNPTATLESSNKKSQSLNNLIKSNNSTFKLFLNLRFHVTKTMTRFIDAFHVDD